MPSVRRGEIYWVDWGKGKGSEQEGIRPALIIQNNTGNQYSPNVVIASFTKSIPPKVYPFQVRCTPSESGLNIICVVDLASIITISKTRLGDKCGQLTPNKMLEVDEAIKASLGLV